MHHNKFYYFDTGVYNTLRPQGILDPVDVVRGASLETLFLQHIRAINDAYELGYKIYYWRNEYKNEVDFVLYREKGLLPFEIKSKKTF